MKLATIRAKAVTTHTGFFYATAANSGVEMMVQNEVAEEGDFIVVNEDGEFASLIKAHVVREMYDVQVPRGRPKKEAPAFAAPQNGQPVAEDARQENLPISSV